MEANSAVNEPLSITSSYLCNGPSAGCRGATAGPGSIGPLATATARFDDFQLLSAGAHDVSFQWAVLDPVTRTTAWTPRFDSVNFGCMPFRSSANPGDCFFAPGTRGDAG